MKNQSVSTLNHSYRGLLTFIKRIKIQKNKINKEQKIIIIGNICTFSLYYMNTKGYMYVHVYVLPLLQFISNGVDINSKICVLN